MFDALIQLHFDYASTAWSYLNLFFPMFPFDPLSGGSKGDIGEKRLNKWEQYFMSY